MTRPVVKTLDTVEKGLIKGKNWWTNRSTKEKLGLVTLPVAAGAYGLLNKNKSNPTQTNTTPSNQNINISVQNPYEAEQQKPEPEMLQPISHLYEHTLHRPVADVVGGYQYYAKGLLNQANFIANAQNVVKPKNKKTASLVSTIPILGGIGAIGVGGYLVGQAHGRLTNSREQQIKQHEIDLIRAKQAQYKAPLKLASFIRKYE